MRFNEFNEPARKQLAERKGLTDDQLDEILPAIGAALGVAGRAAAGAAVRGGAALARGAVKGAGALGRAAATRAARGAARGASSAVKGAGNVARSAARSIGGRDRDEPETNNPNAAVGTQGTQGTQSTSSTQSAASKTISNKIKPGKSLKLPSRTASGKPGPAKNFKITRVKGDEVEIQNPMPKPGEPQKFVYNKDELEGVLGNEVK